jgi:hypothetical protein
MQKRPAFPAASRIDKFDEIQCLGHPAFKEGSSMDVFA